MSDNSNKLCIDLCSGLGGFSRAFVDAGWEVITVDIDPNFKPTICADVCDIAEHATYYPDFWKYKPDLILASPPCERFSFANNRYGYFREGTAQALRIVAACIEIIEMMHPKYFAIENPKARLRWFLGKPKTSINLSNFGYRTIKPTDLWTNIELPFLHADKKFETARGDGWSRFRAWRSKVGKSATARSELPYPLSKSILEAVEANA